MCDAKTLAMTDVVGTTVGATVGAFGAYGKSRGLRRAAEFNESEARRSAEQASRRGEEQLRHSQIKSGRLFSKQRAAFAANGLDIAGSPTVLNVLADTAEEGVREGMVIRDNAAGERRAFLSEAEFEKFKAKSESPFLTGTTSALSGSARVASKWYAYKKAGIV